MTPVKLEEHTVHVYWARLDSARADLLAAQYGGILSRAERERWQKFVFESGRHEYLHSHVLLRCVLSWYAPVAPGDWVFGENAYGKPHIAGPAAFEHLRFNLSHSHGMAAVAVAGVDVGVDVEYIERHTEVGEIADRFFVPEEAQPILKSASQGDRSVFFDYWTLKEAYIKVRGMGLSIPLDSFAMDLGETETKIRFLNGAGGEPADYRFFRCTPLPEYRMAVAVVAPEGACWQVAWREVGFEPGGLKPAGG